jgi:hypothetical protein
LRFLRRRLRGFRCHRSATEARADKEHHRHENYASDPRADLRSVRHPLPTERVLRGVQGTHHVIDTRSSLRHATLGRDHRLILETQERHLEFLEQRGVSSGEALLQGEALLVIPAGRQGVDVQGTFDCIGQIRGQFHTRVDQTPSGEERIDYEDFTAAQTQ